MSMIDLSETEFHAAIRKTDSASAMGAVELLKAAFWVLSYISRSQTLTTLAPDRWMKLSPPRVAVE
jgi:hypothetical protein